jgi:lysophospholipase L1-like esterase
MVFVGDSLTDGAAWTGWVMSTLSAHGHPGLMMHDAAVAGNKIGMLTARFAGDVLALKPDLVVMHIGTNDNLVPGAYRDELEALVRSVRKTGARMLLMTPPLVRDPAKDVLVCAYGAVVRELATRHQCLFVDLHATFEAARKAGTEVLGPDGVHHTIDGWRTMGRSVLDALGCRAPMIEKVPLQPGALTDWWIGPAIPWKAGSPHPALPATAGGFDPCAAGWRKYDREAEMRNTTWWQVSWMERGGVMPMGQHAVKGVTGAASKDHGAFALAVVTAKVDIRTIMRVGGSPGQAVWLNGERVWDGKNNHGYHPDADRFEVGLRRGGNNILVFSNWLSHVALDGV